MQKLLAEELLGDLPQHPQQKLLLRQHHPQHQQGAGRLLRVDSPRVNGAHLWFYTGSRLPIAWWAQGVAIGGRVAIDLVWRRGGPRAPDAQDETHPLCEDVQYCEDGDNDESEQWEEDPSPMIRDEVDGVRASFSWRIAIPREWHRRAGDNGAEGWLCSVKCSARGVDGQPRGGETASSPWFRIVERLQLPQGVENNDQGKMLLRCLHSNACSDAGAAPPGEASRLFPYSSVWKLLNATHGQEEDVVRSQAGSDTGAAWLPREDPRPLNAVSGTDGEIIARREQLRTWFRHECDRQLDEPPMNSSTDATLMHVFALLATGRVEAAALYAARSRNPRLATILAQPVHGRTQTLIEQQLDLWRRNGHQLNGAPVAPPPPPPPPRGARRAARARIHHLRSHCLISRQRVPFVCLPSCAGCLEHIYEIICGEFHSTDSPLRFGACLLSAPLSSHRESARSDHATHAAHCPPASWWHRTTRLEAACWARALVQDAAHLPPCWCFGQVRAHKRCARPSAAVR
jgi:hypothetical protein